MSIEFKKIISLDIGNSISKAYNGVSCVEIPSLVKRGHNDINLESIKVSYGNKQFTIGEGRSFLGNNRYFSDQYLLALLTVISLLETENNISTDIILGIPATMFQSDSLKKDIINHLKDKRNNITINGENKNIHIDNVFISSEGAISPSNTSINLVIDLGGHTVDVTMYDDSVLVKGISLQHGMKKLFKNISNHFSSEFGLSADIGEDLLKTFLSGTKVYTIQGKQESIEFLDDIIYDFVQDIIEDLESDSDFNYLTSNIYLIGGGSCLVDYFKEDFPQIQVPVNPNLVNVISYYEFAKRINNVPVIS